MVKIEKNSFYRRHRISNAVNLYPQFKDLPSGKNDTTLQLKSGLGNSFFVISDTLPSSINYGEGSLVGGTMRFLASSMSMGQDGKLPKLEVYRVDSNIPVTEASGTLADNGDSLTVIGSYLDSSDYIEEENFDGADKRLGSDFQTIGENSDLKLADAWISPKLGADKVWFGGGGFLGMGSNTVSENIKQYFCERNLQSQCYIKPLNAKKTKGFWVPRVDKRGAKEKWSVYMPYWKWNDIRMHLSFTPPPGSGGPIGISAAAEDKEAQENNTIFNDLVLTSSYSNPWAVPSSVPLIFSEATLDGETGGSDGKSFRVYHVWSNPPEDGGVSKIIKRIENKWNPTQSKKPQVGKFSIYNIPKPPILDIGNYPMSYGQMKADGTKTAGEGHNDYRLSLPEISMKVNFKKLAPALPIAYMNSGANRVPKGGTEALTVSWKKHWGDMEIYYSGSKSRDCFDATGNTYFGRDVTGTKGGCSAGALYTLQRCVAVTFSNYKPTEEYLDDFLHNAMRNFYVSGQKIMVGGVYFMSFADFNQENETEITEARWNGISGPVTAATTNEAQTVQSRALGFETAEGEDAFPILEPDRIYAFPIPMHPTRETMHASRFSAGAGMGCVGASGVTVGGTTLANNAFGQNKNAYPFVVVNPCVNGGPTSYTAGSSLKYNQKNYLSLPKSTWADLKFVFDPYAVADTSWASGDVGSMGTAGQFNVATGQATGPLRMYALAGERYRVGWNFDNPAEGGLDDVPFINIAFPCTSSINASDAHEDCWGKYMLASGTKDDSLWPKHMTLWVNNYRWTRGDIGPDYVVGGGGFMWGGLQYATIDVESDVAFGPQYEWDDWLLEKKGADREAEFLVDSIKYSYFNNVHTNASPAVGDMKPFLKFSEGNALTSKGVSPTAGISGSTGWGGLKGTGNRSGVLASGTSGYSAATWEGQVMATGNNDNMVHGVQATGTCVVGTFAQVCSGAAGSGSIRVAASQDYDNSWVYVGMPVTGASGDVSGTVTGVYQEGFDAETQDQAGWIEYDGVNGDNFAAESIVFGDATVTDNISKLLFEEKGRGYGQAATDITIDGDGTDTAGISLMTYPWVQPLPRYTSGSTFETRKTGFNLLMGFKEKTDIPYGSGTSNKGSRWGHLLWNTYNTQSWVDISSTRDVIHPTNGWLSLAKNPDFSAGVDVSYLNAANTQQLGGQLTPYLVGIGYTTGTAYAPQAQGYSQSIQSAWNPYSGSSISGTYYSVTTSAGNWGASGHSAGSDGGAFWIGSGSNDYMGTDGFTQKGLTPFVVQDMPGATGASNADATGSHHDTTNKYTNWAKREHILASAKVIAGPDMDAFSLVEKVELTEDNYIMVDDSSIFTPEADDEYVLYILGATTTAAKIEGELSTPHALGMLSTNPLKLRDNNPIEGNVVFFNQAVTFFDDGSKIGGVSGSFETWIDQLYISPKRYWMHIPYFGSDRGVDSTKDSFGYATGTSYDRTYENAAIIKAADNGGSGAQAFTQNTGSTYNEFMYSYTAANSGTVGMSGVYERPWVLEPGTDDDNSLLLADYGFGSYEEDDNTGGNLSESSALLNLGGDLSRYVEFPLDGLISGQSELAPDDPLTMTLRIADVGSTQEMVLHGDEAPNLAYRPDLIWRFEDTLPEITNFNVEPAFNLLDTGSNLYELTTENLNAVKFTWDVSAEDVWYTMIYHDTRDIINKYHGALCYLPMNEPPTTIGATPTNYFYTSGLNSSGSLISSGSATGARAYIEGLSGYALKTEEGAGYLTLNYDTAYTSTTGSKWLNGLTEFTLVQHFVPNYDLYIGGSNNDEDAVIWAQDNHTASSGASLSLSGYRPVFNMCGQSVTSSTILRHDGITPASIIVTYKSGSSDKKDLKMYVNGQLEDYIISITSGAVSTLSGTTFGSGSYGLMEEFILYDKAYNIVNNNEFVLNTGDLSEYNSDFTLNKSQNARLFVFDYHNIRGKSDEDIASSNQISWRSTTI